MTRIRPPSWLLLIAIVSSAHSQGNPEDLGFGGGGGYSSRIVGGQTLPPGQAYPFFAELEQGCGGSLVWEDMVLTAGHCLQSWSPDDTDGRPFMRRIWLGGTLLKRGLNRTMVEQIRHPDYHEVFGTPYSDYLLVKLSSSALLRAASKAGVADDEKVEVKPIVLNTETNYPQSGQPLKIMGFGRTDTTGYQLEEVLRQVTVSAIDETTCQQLYDNANPGIHVNPELMFCAGNLQQGGQDSCQGDSGGPIIDADGVQVGVVSFGIGCGSRLYPGVYSKIDTNVQTWVQDMICKHSCYPLSDCDPDAIHPCAKLNRQQQSGLGTLTLKIVPDMYPGETAILITHVETGMHVFYQPFHQYPDSGTVPPPVIRTLTNLYAGTYLMQVGDSGYDGMCCWYGAGTIELSQPGVGLLHAIDGDFTSYTDLTFRVSSTGNVSNFTTGTGGGTNAFSPTDNVPSDDVPPTDDATDDGWFQQLFALGGTGDGTSSPASPLATLTTSTHNPEADPSFPGELAAENSVRSVVVNLKYDSFPEETTWILAKRAAAETVRGGTSWVTVDSGAATGLQNPVDSFVQTELSNGIYILQIQDVSKDGMCCWFGYGWGSLTNSTDILWSTNGDFDDYTQVIFEVDAQGHTAVVDRGRRHLLQQSFDNSLHDDTSD